MGTPRGVVIVLGLLAACGGGSGDDCERAIRKMSRLQAKIDEHERSRGDDRGKLDHAATVAKCRESLDERYIDAKEKRASLACILAADGESEMLECMRRGRTVEAEMVLNRIREAATRYHTANGAFPEGEVGPTPDEVPCGNGMRGAEADWSAPLWKTLGVDFADAVQFQYTYESDGHAFTATAIGDLDCDANTVTFTANGTTSGGKPSTTLTKPPRLD